MIPVASAKAIIRQNILPLRPVQLPLQLAQGLVLADDITATMDIPAFPQSSMDGYAFSFSSWQPGQGLKIIGEMPAGSNEVFSLSGGEAVRIFTGAAVPPGTDTVVMQERVTVINGLLHIEDEKLAERGNVRPTGSEIKSGALALTAGIVLTPAAIGFLAGIGVTHVYVYPKPVIGLLVTGKELQQPGNPLEYGQVYESNSSTIRAALEQLQIMEVKLFWADDDLDMLTGVLEAALQQSDMVLLTGGVSVGDYDFVLEAASRCGVATLFHKIKQRPGKPLFFGKKGDQLVFGLPGNPSSVLTCFYEYVTPALYRLSNKKMDLKNLQVPLGKGYQKGPGLTHFLKGWYDGEKVIPLEAQESYRLSSFAKANCLVQLEENGTLYNEGDTVEIHILPD